MPQHLHSWVRHIQVPLDVIANPITGEPTTMMDTETLDRSTREGVDGCRKCDVPLTTETVNTECLV